MGRRSIKKLLVETVTYVFADIPFLDSHSSYCFIKKVALEMLAKYGRAEAESWSWGSKKNNNI